MLYFFDTSALIKRYHLEKGSPTVIQIFESTENQTLIASISLAEFISAFNRIKNRREITETDFQQTLDKFSVDIFIGKIGIIDIKRTHIIASQNLIINFNLSTMDAIILATAIELREFDPVFVCADTRSGLLFAAQSLHISTLNPLS